MGKREMRARAIEFLDGLLEVEQRWDRELEEVRLNLAQRMSGLDRRIRAFEAGPSGGPSGRLGKLEAIVDGHQVAIAGVGERPRGLVDRVTELEDRVGRPLHDGVLSDRIAELEGWRTAHEVANERSWADWKGWADRLERLEDREKTAAADWLVGVERREKDRVVPRLERLEVDAASVADVDRVAAGERGRLAVRVEALEARLATIERGRLSGVDANARERLDGWTTEVDRLRTELEHQGVELGIQGETTDRLEREEKARDLIEGRPGDLDHLEAVRGRSPVASAREVEAAAAGPVDSGSRLPVVDLTTGTAQIIIAREGRPSEIVQMVDPEKKGASDLRPPAAEAQALRLERERLIACGVPESDLEDIEAAPGLPTRFPLLSKVADEAAKIKRGIDALRAGDEPRIVDPRPTAAEAAERATLAGRAGIRLGPGPDVDDPGGIERTKELARVEGTFPAAPEQGRPERIGPGKYVEHPEPDRPDRIAQTVEQKGAAIGADLAAEWRKLDGEGEGLAPTAYLRQLADDLEGSHREGSRWDSPEGTRWIQISDSLARAITNRLRTIAGVLEASG